MQKQCGKCKELKFVEEFYKDRSDKTGKRFSSTCKQCQASYSKEYRLQNLEKVKAGRKAYYETNKDLVLDRLKQSYEKHKNKRLEKQKQWVSDNKDTYLAYQELYRSNNKDRFVKYYANHYQANKESYAKYYQEKRQASPTFRLIESLRTRQGKVLKGKISTTKGLGCDKEFLKDYIAAQWTEGMSWDNYGHRKGKWVLDHRLPLDSHEKTEGGDWDASSPYNQKLVHYTNLQPLWFEDNARKSNKIVAPD